MLPIKKILCPTDFSEPSLAALDVACELAQHFNANLRILYVAPPSQGIAANLVVIAALGSCPTEDERCEDALNEVNNIIRNRVPLGIKAQAEVALGQEAEEIINTADDENVDVIVMGTHGATGWRHLAFGSVAEKVVSTAHRPVLTVHGGPVQERLRLAQGNYRLDEEPMPMPR